MCKCLIIGCLVAVLLGGCSGTYKTKEDLFRDGTTVLLAGDAGAAIVLLKNALEKDQNYFDARLHLAKAYSAAGKFESAERELQKLIRQRPDSRDVRIEIVKTHLRKIQPDEALRELGGLRGTTSDQGEEAELAGWAYALKDRYEDSVDLLTKAITTHPDRSETQLVLARVHARRGSWEKANTRIASILEKDPSNREALYLLAAIRTSRHDFKGARDALDRILEVKPDDLDVLYRKGILLTEQADHAAALAVGDELVKRSPHSAAGHLVRGISLYKKKQLQDAAVALRKAVAIQPGVIAQYYLTLTLYGSKELEQAIGQIRKALDLNPAFSQGRVLLALILMNKNRIDDAIREARRATEEDRWNAEAHNILGSAYLRKGMFTEGVAELNRSIELNPKLVDAHINKGLFHLRTGRFGDAEAELTVAMQINPEIMNSRLILASYYQKRNADDKALSVLKEGLSGKPSDAVLYNMMAESCLHQNNVGEAVAYYRKAREANPDDAYASFRLSAVHVAGGERDKGIRELEALVDRAPGNTRALTTLAALQESLGNESLANKYYKQARETGAPEGYIEEARYLLRNRKTHKALSRIDDAIGKFPSNEALREFKGNAQLSAKQYSAAVKTFDELDRLNSRTGLPLLLKAHLAAGDYTNALERIDRELRTDPLRSDLKAKKSGIYLKMGQAFKAAENAREIIAASPRDAAGYIALAAVHRDEGDLGKGIEVLKNARAKDPSLALALAGFYVQQKDYTAALAQCRKAEELKNDHLPALLQRGMILHAAGRKHEAHAEYQRVLRMNPNYAPALNNLAYLLAEEEHDLGKAMQYGIRAYMLAPDDGATNDTLGYLLLKKGKTEEALNVLKKAAALLPENATVLYHLALAYRDHGNTPLAIDHLKQAVAIGDFPEETSAKMLVAKLK